MRLQFRLSVRRLVLAVIALLSFGAIVLKQSDQYLKASAAVQMIESVNAASKVKGPVAPGTIVSTFGNKLATLTERSQTNPLPTELGGVTIRVIDNADDSHDAQLAYVSPGQINYLIPREAALGAARVVIMNGDEVTAEGKLQIVESAPALFTKDSGDSKMAAGMTTTNGADFASTVNSDGSPRMVSLGAPWNPTTLTLFATGLGLARDLRVRIGNQVLAPTFVGPEESAPGVDRIETPLSMTLSRGMTTVSLVVNSQSSATAGASQASSATQSSATTQSSNAAQLLVQLPADPGPNVLSAADVQTIIAQAVAKAQQVGLAVTIAVVDKEGNVLGVFKMNGARSDVLIGSTNLLTGQPSKPTLIQDQDGLERITAPLVPGLGLLSDGAALAAISKAGTAAFFSTQGSSITTRTAGFIVQENFPPTVGSQPGGPLFGVQFSQLPCSDFRGNVGLATLPFGLAADLGGVGIYKNGVAVGGVAAEGDGFYALDVNPLDFEQNNEERIAVAAITGFRPPPAIRIDRVFIDGMRLPHDNVPLSAADGPPAPPFSSLPGTVIVPISGQLVSRFTPLTLGGVLGRVVIDPNPGDPNNVNRQGYFPFKASQIPGGLTADDVTGIITRAAQQAFRTRAAIRVPTQVVEVNITVVDTTGAVLGEFSTNDAPEFGFDVSCQKARTAVLFSIPNTGAILRSANANSLGLDIGKFADAAAAFGVPLDGSFAFTSRSMGFLGRPFFPDGINGAPNGPFSKPINIWSPFNDGLQIALVKPALVSILTGGTPASGNCSPILNTPLLANGIQIFAGSSALFKNGVLVGAIGISGDGIDQDDIVGAGGAIGFEAPPNLRADQLLIRGVRLPYVKFPRAPALRNLNIPPVILRGARPFGNTN